MTELLLIERGAVRFLGNADDKTALNECLHIDAFTNFMLFKNQDREGI